MAKAVSARIHGDDYQARFFWIQACRMFEEKTKVIKVEIESDKIKSLDDVVVHYCGMSELGETISAEFFQVKFHMTAKGSFTWKSMMDPKFINATSVSILQRIRDAQLKYAPNGHVCRFCIYSPWKVHPDDKLAEVIEETDGRIRWGTMSVGGVKSEMGRIRAAWRKHLGLTSDEELRHLLELIRIKCGPTQDDLLKTMNLSLRMAGMKPVNDGVQTNPYDDLARKFIQQGRTSFTRKELEECCRKEGLWVGRTVIEPDAVGLGIRSFWRFAENIEDKTNAHLCLLRHFNGRFPGNANAWKSEIAPDVEKFLQTNTDSSRQHHILLQCHGTVAFLTGWELPIKSGIDIIPVQNNFAGRHIWRPEASPKIGQYETWQVKSTLIGQTSNPDTILAISATHDIGKDVLHYAEGHVGTAGLFIHCMIPSAGPVSVKDGTHAQQLAIGLVSQTKKLLSERKHNGALHVFFAAPNGLMFFISRICHVLGKIQLYEFDFEDRRTYFPSLSLVPKTPDIKPKHLKDKEGGT